MSERKNQRYGVKIFPSSLLIVGQVYILKNLDAFRYDLFLPLCALAVSSVVLLVLWRFIRYGSWIAEALLAGIGLAVLIGDQIFPASLLRLDGASNLVETPVGILVANTAIFIILPLALVFYRDRLKTVLSDLAILLVFLAVGLSGWNIFACASVTTPLTGMNELVDKSPSVNGVSVASHPNVYMIWLDALETGYAIEYLKDAKSSSIYSGFHVFVNNSTNYPYTAQSYASFMSGTLYKGGDYSLWSQGAMKLRNLFVGEGYRLTSYAKSYFVSSLDHRSKTSEQIFSKASSTPHPYISDFISYWLIKSSPATLANTMMPVAELVGGQFSNLANSGSRYSHVRTIADGIEPLSGVFTLREMISDEVGRQGKGELVIAQALLPHGPYVIDENCEYLGKRKEDPSSAYSRQTHCAMTLVARFLEKLDELDRLESSIVIVFGDHGAGWAGPIHPLTEDSRGVVNLKFTPWTEQMLLSRASAALMIKPASSVYGTNIIYRKTNSQLVDLLPTILGLVGVNHVDGEVFDGVDLFAGNDLAEARAKPFYYFKPGGTMNPQQTEVYEVLYSDDGLRALKYLKKLRLPEDILPLPCDRSVSMSEAADLRFYEAEGLGELEKWGRWTIEDTAIIKIKSTVGGCRPEVIVISLRPFITDGHAQQEAEVFLNNVSIVKVKAELAAPFQKEQIWEIPKNVWVHGGLNTLRIEISSPISPSELGLSVDNRRLGLGVEHLELQ